MAHSNQSPLLKTSWEQVAAAVSAIDTSIGKWLAVQYSIGLTEYRALEHIGASPTHELRITELAPETWSQPKLCHPPCGTHGGQKSSISRHLPR